MKRHSNEGFTVVEVLVAIIVLGIGLVALAGSAGLASRQIGRGRTATIASQLAMERLDELRRKAAIRNASNQRCQHASFTSGSNASPPTGMTEAWTVGAGAVGDPRTVTDSVTYRRANGTTGGFKFTTVIGCK